MTNLEKAQYIVNKLNEKGAGLGNASWTIVEQALENLENTSDWVCTECKTLNNGERVHCSTCGTHN